MKSHVNMTLCLCRMNFRLPSPPGRAKQNQTSTRTLMTSMKMKMIFWMNNSNQEKRRPVHWSLGRVNPKSTTLKFQTMKANMEGQREFHFWNPKESALPQKTQQHQSHVKTIHPTLPPVNTTIIMTHFHHNAPQMPAKISYDLKAVMGSLTILKSQERAQVYLCHIKHQVTL